MLLHTNKKIFVIDAVLAQIQTFTTDIEHCKKTPENEKKLILNTLLHILKFIQINKLDDIEIKNLQHSFETGQISAITETDFENFIQNNYCNLKP